MCEMGVTSTETEFIALSQACQEAMWLNEAITFLRQRCTSINIYEDNQSCINKLDMFNDRTKHISYLFTIKLRKFITRYIVKIK